MLIGDPQEPPDVPQWSDEQCAAMPESEWREARRRCWKIGCERTARLEWCGWRYCVPHWWTQVVRDADGWRRKIEKIRTTEIAKHRL